VSRKSRLLLLSTIALFMLTISSCHSDNRVRVNPTIGIDRNSTLYKELQDIYLYQFGIARQRQIAREN
jgi:hypothetical protein